jgi:putative transposase
VSLGFLAPPDVRRACLSEDGQTVARNVLFGFNGYRWKSSHISRVSFMSTERDPSPRKTVKHYDNGEPHFLTFSCYRRMPLLSKDRTRLWFAEALNDARTVHGFHLWAWVIMPEHVHILLWPPIEMISPDPASWRGRIRGILSSIKRPVGEKAIAYLCEHSPDFLQRLRVMKSGRTQHRFWQAGSGYDENVSEPDALHAMVNYVHNNPVKRGLVSRVEDWPWSSARDLMDLPDSPIRLDRTIPATLNAPWTDRRADRGS